ncbi:uncharacterized protein LOC111487124 [Cucurbita maxima]|uniref:Uncharacterized protein LOC111487124 n=1 Tax=Cucurbita maxima TaxID=3661 RepID=A0A6J1JM50_CUCMA|nr:uncharacterized protein LOC111487124 [Cucurbita maxima]XP_022990143.1 uncharacterized protein LOC111487124 [Cucurbita maxima]XP_022990144.1 uncharacterized protein LOC111487124 [Cucurbita maxima]XP_022990145.1 uncharacterized protein LOC111487124 [Cucurbita maxima]XP_022990146.1 uncharacterized protein LOC111487124 [Cucurbita maxima]
MATSPTAKRDEEHGLPKQKDGGESTVEIEQSLSVSEDSTTQKGLDEVAKDKNIDLKCEAQDEVVERENVEGDFKLEAEAKLDLQSKSVVEKSDQIIRSDDSNEKLEEDKNAESKSSSDDSNNDGEGLDSKAQMGANEPNGEVIDEEKAPEPVFDGTEVPGIEGSGSLSNRSMDSDSESRSVVDRALTLKNFVKEKGVVAVSSVLRRLSGKKDEECPDIPNDETKDESISSKENEVNKIPEKPSERSAAWNPLNYIKMSRDADAQTKTEQLEDVGGESKLDAVMKGRILLYTRLGCRECKEARLFLFWKRLRYVEINIDVYPGRKLELENIAGSSAVPKVFFNSILIGGLNELRELDESSKLDEKIDYLKAEAPSLEAPLPPLPGEDDVSNSGTVDESAMIVRKMKESIVVKDRFYKMRRFTNCFLGSEAVDFLSEDQYLEREEAIEFGRKLASELFFQHVLEENLFEDGGHLYRFLEDDPVVANQCHNVARSIIEVKPKPITDIASRLRFLSFAIFEAYVSEDGKHVDYISIHGSEEFARYLRIVQELQRVELQNLAREEKLAFFINLYNMMAIHAILVCGLPVGALERRKLFGDFKYVIGGATYSLSAIQNGILRGNQRPPYNLMKPFGAKDKRSKVSLPYVEPLIHFALVFGTRSGPALRCYSPGNVDQELMEAARSFLRDGGLVLDLNNNVASVNMILKWFSTDFGKNEQEVMKHVANYLKPDDSQALLELLDSSQLKVFYQAYDWGLNF